MSGTRVDFAGLSLVLPSGWLDISNDLPPNTPPTLARKDGVGALQFSVGHFDSGAHPYITENELRQLFEEFCISNSIRIAPSMETIEGRSKVGGLNRADCIGVWYISNGRDVALVTFVVDETEKIRLHDSEISDVNEIVDSIRLS